jgi:hypothetical protein
MERKNPSRPRAWVAQHTLCRDARRPPLRLVCPLNTTARLLGLEHGMTRMAIYTLPQSMGVPRTLPRCARNSRRRKRGQLCRLLRTRNHRHRSSQLASCSGRTQRIAAADTLRRLLAYLGARFPCFLPKPKRPMPQQRPVILLIRWADSVRSMPGKAPAAPGSDGKELLSPDHRQSRASASPLGRSSCRPVSACTACSAWDRSETACHERKVARPQ